MRMPSALHESNRRQRELAGAPALRHPAHGSKLPFWCAPPHLTTPDGGASNQRAREEARGARCVLAVVGRGLTRDGIGPFPPFSSLRLRSKRWILRAAFGSATSLSFLSSTTCLVGLPLFVMRPPVPGRSRFRASQLGEKPQPRRATAVSAAGRLRLCRVRHTSRRCRKAPCRAGNRGAAASVAASGRWHSR